MDLFKRILSFLLCLIVMMFSFVFGACDQSNDDPLKHEGEKMPVYDENKNLTGYEIRSYYSTGLLSRLDVYDANDEYIYYKIYEYDSDGRLIQETWYKSNGIGDYYYTYEYDDDDNIIEKGYYPMVGNVQIIRYDSNGNEIEKFQYDENDQLEIHSKLEDGKWVDYDIDDNLIGTQTTDTVSESTD